MCKVAIKISPKFLPVAHLTVYKLAMVQMIACRRTGDRSLTAGNNIQMFNDTYMSPGEMWSLTDMYTFCLTDIDITWSVLWVRGRSVAIWDPLSVGRSNMTPEVAWLGDLALDKQR